ncbi:AAA family ATPase [Candidatus Albibeggiatoa sp. nov. BB20]|uniref:AAA family ATPase n=1 Tax=Candidatus Albibeggiatoa sp. nov. BB20 TaxID=3162723 RepID=UPI003365305D
MYYEHFGLHFPPFKITPDTQLFYTGGNRGLVLEALVYAIQQGEGMIKVVGEVGSGKTMLCRMLEQKLSNNIEIVYLANPHLSPDMILHAIGLEMKLPINTQSSRLEVMQQLQMALLEKHAAQQQVVVFVEEAQNMPLETLEEIRLLSNLETTKDKLLQIVLFGQPELDVNLSVEHIRQLKERITHHLYLPALKYQDIGVYLQFRLHSAGYRGPSVFSNSALRCLYKVSEGLMRRLNILADKALLAAFSENKHIVTAKHVRMAIQDSGYEMKSWRFYYILFGFLLIVLLSAGAYFYLNSAQQQPAFLLPRAEIPFKLPPQTQPSTPTTSIQKQLETTQQWLEQTPMHYHTLQVMQSYGDKNVEIERLLQKAELEPFLKDLHPYHQSDKALWGIVYGQFANFKLAQQAIEALPAILQKNKPYALTIQQLVKKFE